MQTPPLHEPEAAEPAVSSFPADLPMENQMTRELRRRREMMDQFLSGPAH